VGDPGNVPPHAWRPRPWRPGAEIPFSNNANGYVTVSSFFVAHDGTWRRRIEHFAAGRALMIDDVGTKVQVSESWPEPSAVIETSPGNFQHWFFLSPPGERDVGYFDGAIRAFIEQKLLDGLDPGMAGVNRVGRLPGHANGKPKYRDERGRPFVTRLVKLDEDLRYTAEGLIRAFDLRVTGNRFIQLDKMVPPMDLVRERVEGFKAVYRYLRERRLLKREGADQGGWIELTCPWTEEHTDEKDNGAAIRKPMMENGFYGAFRCHHGHCEGKGWRELSDWVNAEASADLDAANEHAGSFDELATTATAGDSK
jgi:hypothetical protein